VLRGDVAQQGPGVEEGGLVRVVGERDEVEPELLAEQGEADRARRVGGSAADGVRKDPNQSGCP
jgi:hypothetical protein